MAPGEVTIQVNDLVIMLQVEANRCNRIPGPTKPHVTQRSYRNAQEKERVLVFQDREV